MRLTGTSPHWHRMVALVSLTVAMTVKYTEARCLGCGKLLYLVPGNLLIVRRRLDRVVDGSGRGRVLSCNRCSTVSEVVECVA